MPNPPLSFYSSCVIRLTQNNHFLSGFSPSAFLIRKSYCPICFCLPYSQWEGNTCEFQFPSIQRQAQYFHHIHWSFFAFLEMLRLRAVKWALASFHGSLLSKRPIFIYLFIYLFKMVYFIKKHSRPESRIAVSFTKYTSVTK